MRRLILINLDTHIVIHLLNGGLSQAECNLIKSNETGICAIVVWELAKLKQLGRISLGPDEPAVSNFLRECRIWQIDSLIAVASTKLDFRSDPADELIAATSIVHRVPLLTRDAKLLSSNMIPLCLP